MGLIGDLLYTNKIGKLAIKAMDAQAAKALYITANIANAETPGYKEVNVKPFEAELKQAFKSGVPMKTTHAGHLDGTHGLESFQPQIEISDKPGRLDGNNVDLDNQMTEMSKNAMMYQATITAFRKRGAIINAAIDQNK